MVGARDFSIHWSLRSPHRHQHPHRGYRPTLELDRMGQLRIQVLASPNSALRLTRCDILLPPPHWPRESVLASINMGQLKLWHKAGQQQDSAACTPGALLQDHTAWPGCTGVQGSGAAAAAQYLRRSSGALELQGYAGNARKGGERGGRGLCGMNRLRGEGRAAGRCLPTPQGLTTATDAQAAAITASTHAMHTYGAHGMRLIFCSQTFFACLFPSQFILGSL